MFESHLLLLSYLNRSPNQKISSMKTHSKFLMTLVSSALFAGAASLSAQIISLTTADGSGGDTYVNRGSINASFDSSEVLLAGSKSGGDNSKVSVPYMKFDISGLTGLENATSASISLTLADALPVDFTFHLYALPDGLSPSIKEDFDAATLTFQTAYLGTNGYGISYDNYGLNPNKNPPLVDLGEVTLLSGSTAGTDLVFSDAAILDFLKADTNGIVSVAIRSTTTDTTVSFYSSENLSGGTLPTLSVTTSAVPEPSAVALMIGLGGFGVALVRRRRSVSKDVHLG